MANEKLYSLGKRNIPANLVPHAFFAAATVAAAAGISTMVVGLREGGSQDIIVSGAHLATVGAAYITGFVNSNFQFKRVPFSDWPIVSVYENAKTSYEVAYRKVRQNLAGVVLDSTAAFVTATGLLLRMVGAADPGNPLLDGFGNPMTMAGLSYWLGRGLASQRYEPLKPDSGALEHRLIS